ncbi:hypothetical protein [Clostridium lundense]|uniref:hypothetical protein n=1 Tax=Clostridium lundense TaxID=319475 RepID=UPI000489CEAB|nr:hypothetical protein [Clostridium lundense]
MTGDNVVFILAILVVVAIVICIIKKVAKLVIAILIAFLAVTLVKGFMAGKSAEDMLNSTKTDAVYTKQLYNYTEKVKDSVQVSLSAIDNKSLPKLKEENKKLHTYLNEVIELPHGDELKVIHDKYCNYLKNIVSSSDTAVSVGNFTESSSKSMENIKSNLNKYMDDLTKIEEKF